MAVSKKDRAYILKAYPNLAVGKIAAELGIKPGEVKDVLAKAGIEAKDEEKSGRKGILGYAPIHPLGIALLVAIVSVVYLNSVRNGFHYDDIHSLLQNLGVRVEWTKNPESRSLLYRYFYEPDLFSSRPNVAMPRPLLMFTFGLNYMWTNYEPWSWVLVNIIIHLVNVIIVYAGLSHLSGRPRIALLTAILFAVHPINTESVNYINCRSESFTVFWMLLTMYFFARSMREDRMGLAIASFVSFALGLLTKELAFTTPALLVVIDYLFIYPVNKDKIPLARRLLFWYLPLAGVWVGYIGYRMLLMGHTVVERTVRPLSDNFISQMPVLVKYIRLMFFPFHQNISYENRILLFTMDQFTENPFVGMILPSMILLAGILAFAIIFHRRHPVISFTIFMFFIVLSITTLVPLNAVMNEHRMYLPSLGACLLIVGLLDRTAAMLKGKAGKKDDIWPASVQFFAIAIALVFVSLTVARNFTWHTDLTVWRDSILKSPTKAQVVSDLGNAYYRGGRDLTSGGDIGQDGAISKEEAMTINQIFREVAPVGPINAETRKTLDELYMNGLKRAEQLYMWGIRVENTYYKAWHNLGTINYTYADIAGQKRDREKEIYYLNRAAVFFENATKIYKNGESFNDMGSTLMKLGRMEEDPKKREQFLEKALEAYKLAVKYNPELYKAYFNMYLILDLMGRGREGLPYIQKAISINPTDVQLRYFFGKALEKENMLKESLDAYNECLRLAPDYKACQTKKAEMERELLNAGPTPALP